MAGMPIRRFNKQTLERAMSSAARYLEGQPQTVVAVGGVLSVCFLETRAETSGVDVFGCHDFPETLFWEAAEEAVNHRDISSAGWLSHSAQDSLSAVNPQLSMDLTREAISQGDVLFEKSGLKVFASPWYFAFSWKIARIQEGQDQSEAVSEAVHLLHQHIIKKNGGQPVHFTDIEGWAARFHRYSPPSYGICWEINEKYRKIYGTEGILFPHGSQTTAPPRQVVMIMPHAWQPPIAGTPRQGSVARQFSRQVHVQAH
jgi:hypothetical protein